MVVKKESKNKQTGEVKVHYTSDKQGSKVVIRGGEPVEVEMSQDEISHRDHGEDGKRGAVGSSNKQKGQTRANVEAAKRFREKDDMKEGRETTLSVVSRKIDNLKSKLRSAKLKRLEIELVKREGDVLRKEKQYSRAEQIIKNDRKKLKDKHSFFAIEPENIETDKLEDNLARKAHEIVGNLSKSEVVSEVTIDEKLNKIEDISKMVYGNKKQSYNSGSFKSLYNKDQIDIDEADGDKKEDDDEESGDISGLDDIASDSKSGDDSVEDSIDTNNDKDELSFDDGETEEGGEEEGDMNAEDGEGEDNEVRQIVDREEFNVHSNNSYDFYDFVIDKLFSNTAQRAINIEYSAISKEKRKIMPASELYDRTVKRLGIMNKAEAERLESQGDVGEDEDTL